MSHLHYFKEKTKQNKNHYFMSQCISNLTFGMYFTMRLAQLGSATQDKL